MKYLTQSEQLRIERQKNEILIAENAKLKANVDYIAMMCDVAFDEDCSKGEEDEQI